MHFVEEEAVLGRPVCLEVLESSNRIVDIGSFTDGDSAFAAASSGARSCAMFSSVWNAVSDPREVLDLRGTARWRSEAIARFITDTTVDALRTRTFFGF